MDEDNLTLYTLTLYTPGPTEERRAEVAIGFTAARERVRQLLSQEAGAERVGGADKQGETTDARTEAACALPREGELFCLKTGRCLQVAPVAAADEGTVLYESECEESLWALAREAGIDFEEERCDPLALLWSLRGQRTPD
jgi:hypothetical protein